jgi:hypothetical protein
VCKQVIERHLLRPLPALFSPENVAAYDEENLSRIAAESEQAMARRKRLLNLYKGLMESLAELNSPLD